MKKCRLGLHAEIANTGAQLSPPPAELLLEQAGHVQHAVQQQEMPTKENIANFQQLLLTAQAAPSTSGTADRKGPAATEPLMGEPSKDMVPINAQVPEPASMQIHDLQMHILALSLSSAGVLSDAMAGRISGMLGEMGADSLAELYATGKLPQHIDAAIATLDASGIEYADVHDSRWCVLQHIEDYSNLHPSLQQFARYRPGGPHPGSTPHIQAPPPPSCTVQELLQSCATLGVKPLAPFHLRAQGVTA